MYPLKCSLLHSVQSGVKWSIAVIREACCLMSPSTPQPHRDMENITAPIHIGITRGGRSGVQRNKRAFWGLHRIGGIDPLYSGQVRAANPNAPSIPALQGCARRELCGRYTGGWTYPFLPCLQPLICLYLPRAITLNQTEHVLLNMLYKEVGFYSEFYSRDGRTASNYMLMKVISHALRGC